MSSIKSEIKIFLDKVEDKLPGWLKDNSKERMDILTEMEEHILDKVEELARDEEPDLIHVRQAIASMGSPEEISKEFKKRGTPKMYITEEWWGWFLKVLKVVLIVIGCFTFIPILFSIGNSTFWEILIEFLRNIWGGLLFGFILVSLIFIALSMNGYLPQDFKDAFESEDVNLKIFGFQIATSHEKKCESVYNREEAWKEKYEKTYDRAMGGKSEYEPKYKEVPEPSKVYHDEDDDDDKKSHKVKPPIKKGSLLSDSIWGIIWNIFFIVQPIESLNNFFTQAFLDFVKITAAIALVLAVIKGIQSIAGMYRITTQQFLLLLFIGVSILAIPVWLEWFRIEEVYTIFSDEVNFKWRPGDKWAALPVVILWISVITTGIEALDNLGKVTSYPRRLRKYTAYLDEIRA